MKKAWWALSLVLGGCAEPVAPGSGFDALPDAERIFSDVKKIRELPSQAMPRVQFLRASAFLVELQREPDRTGIDAYAEQLGLSSKRVSVTDEQARLLATKGFYRQHDKTIFMLDDPNRRFPLLLEHILAHESVHALQDQNGLLPDREAELSLDERLARLALIEGDATLGMVLYQERDWRTPVRRLADRVRRGFAEEPISRYVDAAAAELADSPAYQQEIMIFPYRAGAAFVGALLGTGGYELVAKAYAAPPRSTAQILHPERYSRGEQPAVIPPPAIPAGYSVSYSSVFGELMTRSLLLRCNPEERAIEAANGWRGDLAVTLRQGDSQVTLHQWLTDSESEARELAAALRATCDAANANAALTFVAERGARVVAARGGDSKLAAQVGTAWLEAAVPTPGVQRPLGSSELAPHPASRKARLPYVEDGLLRVPALGIELPVPKDFKASLDGQISLIHRDSHASVELVPVLGEYFEQATDQILLSLSRSMELSIAFSNVVPNGKPYSLKLRTGRAMCQEFEHSGTAARGRVVAVPLCEGAGLLAIIQYYGDDKKAEEHAAVHALNTLEGSTHCRDLVQ